MIYNIYICVGFKTAFGCFVYILLNEVKKGTGETPEQTHAVSFIKLFRINSTLVHCPYRMGRTSEREASQKTCLQSLQSTVSGEKKRKRFTLLQLILL